MAPFELRQFLFCATLEKDVETKVKIFVADAGQFGTANAILFGRVGHEVALLVHTYDQKQKDLYWSLKYGWQNTNYIYLPKAELPPNLVVTDNLDMVGWADVVLIAVPAQFVQSFLNKLLPQLKNRYDPTIVLMSKGFDPYTQMPWGVRIANILARDFESDNFAIISGPMFANDLTDRHKFLGASAASENTSVLQKLKTMVCGSMLGLVETGDIIGVSWGGCLKNGYAVGYGILKGLAERHLLMDGVGEYEKYQEKAWLYLELALSEMGVFLNWAGACPETVRSLSVRGDFLITSYGTLRQQSRNVSFGKFLAQCPSKSDIRDYIKTSGKTVEGCETIKILWKIAQQAKLHTPLLCRMYDILESGADPNTLSID